MTFGPSAATAAEAPFWAPDELPAATAAASSNGRAGESSVGTKRALVAQRQRGEHTRTPSSRQAAAPCDKLVKPGARSAGTLAASTNGGTLANSVASSRRREPTECGLPASSAGPLATRPLDGRPTRAPIWTTRLGLWLVLFVMVAACSILQAAHCFTLGLGSFAQRHKALRATQLPTVAAAANLSQLEARFGGEQLLSAPLKLKSKKLDHDKTRLKGDKWDALKVPQSGQDEAAPAAEEEEARAAHWSLPNRPSLFNIIRFPNEECFDSSNQSGTCYTAFECKLLGGQPSSPCAAGFGSCCIVSRTCHVTTREKVVYFKNPSYPSADSDEKFCDLTVEMSDLNVCQLRLDFLDFQLDPPTNGACKDDYLEISASGMPPQSVPRLCGLNRNQHLYINLPQDLSERSASIVFYTDPVGDHRWQVKVTQIDCNHYRPIDWKRHYAKFASSPLWNAYPNLNGPVRLGATGKYSTTFASGFQTMSQTASALAYEFLKPQFTPRAPMGCLQYFNQPSGIIESFNFGQYLNNLDYSICIQRQPDTCRIVFASSDYDWSLNGVGISGSSSGVGDQDCARDYLLIPGASRTGDGFTYDRYCGGRLHYYRGQALSAPVVVKTSGPIVLRFHSDAHFESVNNGGFRLQYDQSTQDCVYHTAEEAGSLASQQLILSTLSDSRPLNPFPQDAGSPVLYAAQQLGPLPVVQQLAHTDQNQPPPPPQQQQHSNNQLDLQQPQQHQLMSEDAANRPTRGQLANEPNGNSSQGAFNLLQVPTFGADLIKRRHGAAELTNRDDATDNSKRPSPVLLADLSKAFQLITSSRAARSGWPRATIA